MNHTRILWIFIIAVIAVKISHGQSVYYEMYHDKFPTSPYEVICPDELPFAGSDVTEIWQEWKDTYNPKNPTPDSLALHRIVGHYNRVAFDMRIGGVWYHFSESFVDRESYLVYAGWHFGYDLHPHPRCGVWLVNKDSVDRAF